LTKFDCENLIVIDHHKTTIENLAINPDFKPEGLIGELDNKQSACELAWKYFFPDVSLPLFVQYISYYDTWRTDLPNWEEHILAFYEGLKVGLPSFEEDKQSWLDLIKWSTNNDVNLQNVYAQFMSETLRWGKKILRHTTEVNNEIIKNSSFITEFEGYKALAINSSDEMRNFILGSPSWKVGDFDIGICFVYHGGSQNSYTCHLRTDKQQIDISEISKLHKGGGHKGAGGFQTKKLPFKFNKERK
jgi:nanoRNase/pAp phosphatase (c-di-AMP/oligoRNAs hydrolase)